MACQYKSCMTFLRNFSYKGERFCSVLSNHRVQNPSLVSVIPTELFCWALHLPFRRVQNPSLVSVVPTELFCWASHLPFRRVQTRR